MRRTIDDVVESVRNASKGGILLVGAGCSVKAGIPTAAEIVEVIRERFPRAYQRAKTKSYFHCMSELTVGQRRELIAEFVDQAKINWAHICIAQLMKHGFIERVLTTNFDLLVVRACALLGLFPPVYDLAVSGLADPHAIPDRAVLSLHGQYTGTVLMNGHELHARHLRPLATMLDEAARDRVFLVVGYGGENDPVFDCLANVPRFQHSLYWVGHRDAGPPAHLSDRLLDDDRLTFFVDGYDADDFFVTLAQKLDCFPPDFVRTPFSYLDELLGMVTTYTIPTQEAEVDVAAETRRLIRTYVERHEREASSVTPPGTRNGGSVDVLTARFHLMAGDYDKVASVVAKNRASVAPELADTASWAYVMQGNSLLDEALGTPEEADRLFAAACEKYSAALELKPNKSEALSSWARALVEQAIRKSGDQADWLYALAGEKYRALLKAKPDSYEGLYQWGSALLEQATRNGNKLAESLLTLAAEKFQGALELKPDNHQTLLKWGNALVALAQRKGGEEVEPLLMQAAEKYRGALKIKPTWEAHHCLANVLVAQARRRQPGKDSDRLIVAAADQYQRAQRLEPERAEIVRDWAEALVEQALRTRGEASDKLVAVAGQKYEAFLALVPNDPDARLHWAQTLFDLGKRRPGAAGEPLLQAAAGQFEHTLTIKPDLREAMYGWGNVLLERATRASGAEADTLYAEAIEKYRATLELKPDMYEAVCSWGNALFEQAKRQNGEAAEQLLAAATGQYERALGLKSDLPEALYNWGNALVELAMRKAHAEEELRQARSHFLLIRTAKETDALFALAGAKYHDALKAKPDMHEALNNWGTVLLEQAKRKAAEDAESLFADAKDKLLRAEAISPGSGAYNLACVSALRGDESECQTWLEKGDQTGTLPPRTHLANDPDLDKVREAGWFKGFLAKG